jgi:putative ubiquitin-RnfH superfamily antitoxin RatB of RatAB toxin-antitoxin module
MANEVSVEVCYPAPDRLWRQVLRLPAGATAAQALAASSFGQDFPGLDAWALGVGIYGRRAAPDTPLADGDRVEVYRALVFDPKESRRRRVEHRRAKQAAEGKERPPGLL